MAEILAPIANRQRDPIDEAGMARIGARLRAQGFERSAREIRRRRILIATASATACCLFLGGAYSLWTKGGVERTTNDGPLLLANGEVPTLLESGISRRARFDLSDGSRLDLDDNTLARVVENDSSNLTLSLERGEVTLDIPPNGPRNWVIDAGIARIVVVGTRFRVSRTDNAVEVDVERGEVSVESTFAEGGQQRLTRGQRTLIVDGRQVPPTREKTQSTEEIAEVETTEPRQEPLPMRGWRPLARRGEFDEAFQLLGSEGLARETRQARMVDDLFLLADVARRSGHPREAVAPLEQIVVGHATNSRASVAAFTLGRLNLNVLGNSGRARWAFERAIALGAPPALEEDAYALLVEASIRNGDRARASAAGREYLRRYPHGRLAASVRSWAGLEEGN